MRFTLNQVVQILIAALDLRPSGHATVRARLQHFQRLDFPEGIKGSAPGRRANYDEDRLLKVVLAFELLELGFTPGRMKATVAQHWPEIRTAIATAAANPSEASYIATYPNSLDSLRDPIDKHEVAWVHGAATLPQLAEMFAQRTALEAPNFAAINVTGLVLGVATAVATLPRSRMAPLPTAEEYLSTLKSWKAKAAA